MFMMAFEGNVWLKPPAQPNVFLICPSIMQDLAFEIVIK